MNLREIDKLVAVHVMGWEEHKEFEYREFNRIDAPRVGDHILVPPSFEAPPTESGYNVLTIEMPTYSEDIAAAWTVVEAFDNAKVIRLLSGAYTVQIDDHYAGADTAPLAICRCALRAKGVEVPA